MKTKFIISFFVIVWLALVVRVFFLAVHSNEFYEKLSLNNTIKTEMIPPVRGEIVDVHGKSLAINKLGFKVQLRPHLYRKTRMKIFNDEIDFIMQCFPNLDKAKIVKNYKKKDSYYNHEFIDVVDFVSYKKMLPVYSKLILRKNIKIIPSPKRFYPYGKIGGHVLGYVAKANKKDIQKNNVVALVGYVGKTGLERYYNGFLQGKPGSREIKVNASNQEVAELSYKKAKEDNKLTLHVDIDLQRYITYLFEDKAGAVVVMDVNGSILSAGSFPEYDLNSFVNGISYKQWNHLISSLEKPFTNKLINGLYPPGSVIKPAIGLVYLTNGIGKNWRVECKSSFPLGRRIFRCWKKKGHGITNITKAIRESCDDYFYKGSIQVGIKKMSKGLIRYGLGKKTGVDLPNEFIGIVPSREWKMRKYRRPWYIGETVNTSIGQGDFLVTPLQIAQLTALMATSKLPTPHFAKKIGNKAYKPVLKDVLNKDELKKLPIIRKAMYEVCNYPSGTATRYLSSKVKIAGKTGTAQVIAIMQDIKERKHEHELSYYKRSHAWFATYGPYKNPKYVVVVLVEHGGHGGAAAGEIVSKIYNWLLENGYIKN